jgi:hypothetical protein
VTWRLQPHSLRRMARKPRFRKQGLGAGGVAATSQGYAVRIAWLATAFATAWAPSGYPQVMLTGPGVAYFVGSFWGSRPR